MHLTRKDIQNLERIKRLNLINSISGIKPANLIGTVSNEGASNLAIFSSVLHLGSNPPVFGIVSRPTQEVKRHTYENILENGYYTINHIHEGIAEQAHFTSAKFKKDESEFTMCNLTEEYLFDFKAPFVKESKLKIGLKHIQNIAIDINQTILIIGEVEHLILPEKATDSDGYIDLSLLKEVGISGLNTYYSLKKIASFPYVRREDIDSIKKNTDNQ
jgi:flavin reductase (DIM6/NTAB) family NADH-FMN oxidoreductase RutF